MNDLLKNGAIDLFCGCGGMSVGLQMSNINVLAGIDNNPKFTSTFEKNFPRASTVMADISALTPASAASQLNIAPEELLIIVGGPPCQGFSKNTPRKQRALNDPRNLLVNRFIEFCEFFRPAIILMENVAEMKNGFDGYYSEEVIDRLEKAGYTVSHSVLNAADFGVPQRRRRAFFLATRFGCKLKFPEPTHHPKGKENSDLFKPSKKEHVSVWEAIGDLPPLGRGDHNEHVGYGSPPFTEYQKRMRGKSTVVSNHISRKLQPKQLERISLLKPGQGLKDLPERLQTRGGYSGAYGRLTKEMIAPTITRWMFHPGSGRWGHPVDDRLITVREAARLQGFPDSYEFSGTYIDQSGQIGNAVPPLLVSTIVDSALDQIDGAIRSRNSISSSNPMHESLAGISM